MNANTKPTRASARTKPSAPPTTRTTRAKAAANSVNSTSSSGTQSQIPQISKQPTTATRAARKPLLSRNIETPDSSPKPTAANSSHVAKPHASFPSSEPPKEAIQAFLRIRPPPETEHTPTPYFSQSSSTQVRLTDPREDASGANAVGASRIKDYTFTHVFPSPTTQSEVFQNTTLPLIRDVLHGQNALLFAHGVTGSGKTFTMNGDGKGNAGIIPRTFDVLFNSIRGLEGDFNWVPARLTGVEDGDQENIVPSLDAEDTLVKVLPNAHSSSLLEESEGVDDTSVKLDKNHRYSIFISYAEVYNEKVFDLLTSITPEGALSTGSTHSVIRKGLALKNSPESEATGRYISNLSQFKVKNAAEAKALLKLGQLRRQVFGTLANRESSRSHAIVIVKVMQCHRGELKNKDGVHVSRLTLVDLAGSERNKVAQTTGDRLKEAANINKSLMVLGRCLHTLRSNQHRLAASLGIEEGRMDTRDVRRRLSVVPYNNSTLTKILMDYFDGEGHTAMIVNVNPQSTSYDELAHVMAFAAIAQDVKVAPTLPRMPKPVDRRRVTLSMGGKASRRGSQVELEILEENDEATLDEEYEDDPLIDALFEDNERLQAELHFWKQRAYELDQKIVSVEMETRREVMTVMRAKMARMEEQYSVRQRHLHEENERINDEKIDLLQGAGLLASPVKKRWRHASPMREEEDETVSLATSGSIDEDLLSSETDSVDGSRESSASPSRGYGHAATPVMAREKILFSRQDDEFIEDSEDEEAVTTDGESRATTDYESRDESEGSEQATSDDEWRPVEQTPKPQRKASHSLSKRLDKLKITTEDDDCDKVSSSSIQSLPKKKRTLAKTKLVKEEEVERVVEQSGLKATKRRS